VRYIFTICVAVFFLTSQAWAGSVCNGEMTAAVNTDVSMMSMSMDKKPSDREDSSDCDGDMSDLCASACMLGCVNMTADYISHFQGETFPYSLKSEFPINDKVFSGFFVFDPPPPRL